MGAIEKGSLVLVTGASGFVASHIVRELLRSGFRVRGTVRSESQGKYLEDLFKKEGGEGAFFSVVVPDMTKEGAFDEAASGMVDAVIHTASPTHFKAKHPRDIIDPALAGTVGLLKSISKENRYDKVKRVVLTSGCAAVMNTDSVSPPHTFYDDDWNTDSPRIVDEQGGKTSGVISYMASKTIAERAFWKYMEENKTPFDGVALLPSQVFGEVIHKCDSADATNNSLVDSVQFLVGGVSEEELKDNTNIVNWVNVKDVAKAHVSALLVPEAGGNRFIIAAGLFAQQDHADTLRKLYPDIKGVPVGRPNTHDELCKTAFVFNSDKAKRILGVKYTSWDETMVDMTDSLRARFGV